MVINPDCGDGFAPLEFEPLVYTPRGRDLAWGRAEVLNPSGSLCVRLGSRMCVVLLRKDGMPLNQDHALEPATQTSLHWRVELLPMIGDVIGEECFRPARWGELQSVASAKQLRYVRFRPDLLDHLDRDNGERERRTPVSFGRYRNCDWRLEEHGLRQGEVYAVEHVFDEPFLKVAGVSLVTCAEMWEPK